MKPLAGLRWPERDERNDERHQKQSDENLDDAEKRRVAGNDPAGQDAAGDHQSANDPADHEMPSGRA